MRPSGALPFSRQEIADRGGAVLGRIDQRDGIAEQPARMAGREQGIMSAAEDKSVDPSVE